MILDDVVYLIHQLTNKFNYTSLQLIMIMKEIPKTHVSFSVDILNSASEKTEGKRKTG